MGLFDFLKRRNATAQPVVSGSYIDVTISDIDLKVLINKAIAAFEANPGADSDQLTDLIKTYQNDEGLATALYRFIPIAYCRLFIPEPAYSDEYVIYRSENDKTTFFFSQDPLYTAVLAECKTRLATSTVQDAVMSILYHSAEFKAINDALNHGSALTDLVCSPAYFL